MLHLLFSLWLAFVVMALPGGALAQGTAQLVGGLTAGHLVMLAESGLLVDAGGPTATGETPSNGNLPGTRSSGLALVNPGQGLALYSGYATSAYSGLKFGFDANGNALITIDSIGGSAPSCNFEINGVLVPCGGTSGTGGAPGGSAYDIQYKAGASTFGGVTLTDGQIVVGQTGGVPLAKTMSGDGTLSVGGALTVASIGGKAVSLANSLTVAGNFAPTLTFTATTNSTFPAGTHSLAPLDSPTFSGTVTVPTVVGTGRIVTITSDTAAATDCGKTLHFTNAGAITATLPNNITTLECTITYIQEGAGQITFAAAAGATLHSFDSYTKTAGQWAIVDITLNTNVGGTSAVYTLSGRGA